MTTIDLIIPVFNEEKRLQKTFEALNSFAPQKGLKIQKVIFVNDGSTDNTLKLIKTTKIKFKKHVISYSQNQGKGYAVKQGLLAAQSDYALFFDADMSTPLTEIKKFLPYIKKGCPIIIGTRKNGHSTVIVHQPFVREHLGRIFTRLSQIILGTSVTDFTCGFKAFSKEAYSVIAPLMQINRWGYDSEIIFIAQKHQLPIQEKSVTWSDEPNTKVKLLKDVFRSLNELFQIRLNYLKGNYEQTNTKKTCHFPYNRTLPTETTS